VVFPDGSSLIVAGGLMNHGGSSAAVMRIDTRTGRRAASWSLRTAVHDAGGAAIGVTDLVIGGGATTSLGIVQRLPATGGAAHAVGSLPVPRSDVSVVSAGGAAYVVGGYDGHALQGSVLSTMNGRTFHTVGRLPVPVRYAAVAVANGALWVVGGRTDVGGATTTTAVQRMSLATGRSAVVSRLAHPISDAVAVVLNGTVLICGGDRRGNTPTDAVLRLDTSAGDTRPAGHLSYAVADAAATVIGSGPASIGYLVGGETNHPVATVQTLRLE
jgi:hypothetical protein